MNMSPKRPILVRAVRDLVAAARSERALVPLDSEARQFYLGVEAAAEEVLHPELGVSRGESWLDHQRPSFRDGYLKTSTRLTTAKTAAEPPLQVPLPRPDPKR
jgi:hypothetical protein